MYYTITNEKENYLGFQYQDGLNNVPLKKNKFCVGGLYFTEHENVHHFLNDGCFIREVTLPETAQMVIDPNYKSVKYQADSIILGKKWNLADIETI